MRRLLRIFKARGLWLGLVLAMSLSGGALFQLNYVNAQLAATPWPMFHHDLQHTGRSPYIGPGWTVLKWYYTAGGSVAYSSPALASDGTVYFGSDDGKLYAINPDGTFKWSYNAVSSVRTSPAIGSDGTIYVSSGDNKLYAINPNGSFKWSYTTASSIYSSAAIASDGTIYVGSGPHNLYAINPNGSLKWCYTGATDSFESSPAIGSDGTIYVGSDDWKLYAISDNGTAGNFKWSYTTTNSISSSSPAIAGDGTVYVGSNDHKLYAISDNGSFKWSYTTGGGIWSSPAIASDGTIYVGSNDNKLYAINPNGSFKWSYPTGDNVQSSPAVGGDGTIYVGSLNGVFYALNPTNGLTKWTANTSSPIHTASPAIGSDGTIYFGTDNGVFRAYSQNPPTVTGVNPNSGNGGQTLNNVIITGTNFTLASTVSFGAGITVNTFNINSNTQITASITIASGAAAGTRDISVTTPFGTGTMTGGFTVLQPTQPQPTQSVNTATGTGTATFTTSAGSITNLSASATTPCGSLAGLSFPQGFFSFTITNITPGSTVTITMALPSNMPTNTQYWKCINGQWVNVTSLLGSNDGDNVLTLTITDGGLGDADGLANGTIVDPGGPAIAQAQAQAHAAAPAAHRVAPLKPASMSVQYLSVSPQQAAANQPVTISINVANAGDQAGSLNVALKINGLIEQSRTVSVGPQGTQPVKFTVTKAQPGTYTVDIGGQQGSFTILGVGSTTTSKSANVGLIAILAVLILATVVILMLTFRRRA